MLYQSAQKSFKLNQILFQHSNSEVLKIKEIIEAWCVEDEYNFKQTFKDERVCLEVHQ